MSDDGEQERAEVRLPWSAWVMAAVSFGFVFLGIQFIAGAMVMLTGNWFGGFAFSPLLFVPFSIVGGLSGGWLSAKQTLDQARKKLFDQLAAAAPKFVCRGCGEEFDTHEPHCPLCGRKPDSQTVTRI